MTSILKLGAKELELVRRQKQALEKLLKTDKISQLTYDLLIKGIKDELTEIETRIEASADKLISKIGDLETLVGLLELRFADAHVRYSAGEIDKERFEHESNTFNLGLKALRTALENLENTLKKLREKRVEPEKGFYFYENLGRPLHRVALSLKEFPRKLKRVPLASIEFHQNRGDFSKWIQDVFQEARLADLIEKIEGTGEGLRRQLLNNCFKMRIPREREEKLMQERLKILGALTEVRATMGLKELAEKTDLSIGRTLGYLKGLVNAGYVEKTGKQYSITPEGKTALKALQPVPHGTEFHFYTEIGKYTGLSAESLMDFCELLKEIDVRALNFHVSRGDFERWITEVLNDTKLADEIAGIRESKLAGENLRNEILGAVNARCSKFSKLLA